MKKLLISLLLIYSIVLLGCPKADAVRSAADASSQLGVLTGEAIKANDMAYDAQIINLATKDRVARALIKVSQGGAKFNAMLEGYIAESGSKLPADKIGILNKIFRDEVMIPFYDALKNLKVLTPDQADALQTAINALNIALLTIANGFTALKSQVFIKETQIYVG